MKPWQIYSILAVIVWGIWGFCSKLSVDKLGLFRAYLAFSLGSIILPLLMLPFNKLPPFSNLVGIGIFTGFLGGLGTFLLSGALKSGRANVVIPITSQYILITVILSTLFYREPLTAQRITGIVFSIVAIILLSM